MRVNRANINRKESRADAYGFQKSVNAHVESLTDFDEAAYWESIRRLEKDKPHKKFFNQIKLSKKQKPQKRLRYFNYLHSTHWESMRKRVLERDNHKCTKCGADNKVLHVHHKTYCRLFHEKIEDLITLCEDCHKKLHRNIKKKKIFGNAKIKILK